jgi:hypothetical protein
MEEFKKFVLLLIANEIVCARIKHGKCIKQIVHNQAIVRIFIGPDAADRGCYRCAHDYASLSAVIWKESKQHLPSFY